MSARVKLLIIEDNAIYADMVKDRLGPLADEITIVRSWDTARIYFQSEHPQMVWIDLILDGTEATPATGVEDAIQEIREIRARIPNTVIVVVSGVVIHDVPDRVMEAGADAFISKMDAGKDERLLSLILLAIQRARGRGAKADDILDRAMQMARPIAQFMPATC